MFYMLPNKQAFQSLFYPHSRKHICLVLFSPLLSCSSPLLSVFSWTSLDDCTVLKLKKLKTKIGKSVKAKGRMEDEDTGPMLPLAMYLEDNNCSVNTHGIMLSGWTTRKDRHFCCAYNPDSRTISESHTSLRNRRKENRAQEEMANSMLHSHSIYVLGLCETLHTHSPILSS